MVSKDKLLPKLRFKKFVETGAWQKYLLEELVEVNNGKDYKHLGKGEIPVYGTGGYMTKVNAALSYEKDAIGIGRKGTIDKPYILKAPYWTVDTLFYAIPKFDSNINFFQGIFKNINWLSKQESTGVPSLSKSTINNIEILIPTIQEQQQIGTFLKKIDKMIQLQQLKVNKVKDFKSAYLSEMFPKEGEKYPEKRFEGFTEPWGTGHLGQVAGINKGEQLNKEKMIKSGKYYVLNGGINPSGYTNTYNTKEQTISISEGGNSCGYVNYNEEKFWSGGHNYALTNPKIDVLYLYYFLKSRQDEIMRLRVGSGLPNIQITALSEFDILYPLRDEQEKIGQFFKNLDNQISLEEEKLMKLQKLKQAYLADMFV